MWPAVRRVRFRRSAMKVSDSSQTRFGPWVAEHHKRLFSRGYALDLAAVALAPGQAPPNCARLPQRRDASRSAMACITLSLIGRAALRVAFR